MWPKKDPHLSSEKERNIIDSIIVQILHQNRKMHVRDGGKNVEFKSTQLKAFLRRLKLIISSLLKKRKLSKVQLQSKVVSI